jgi:membrane protein
LRLKKLDKILNKREIIFFKELIFRFKDDNVTAIGAQLSYYLILSIFPFLIFFLNILSFTPLVREDVLQSIIAVLPLETQRIVTNLVMETIINSSETLLSFGAITGIWAASKGIMALIRAINKAYDVEETRSYIELRLLAIIFTLALLILLTIVLLTIVFGELIGLRIVRFLGLTLNFMIFWEYFRVIISIASMILIFALLFRFSPSLRKGNTIHFKDTLPGAIFSSVGWIITSTMFSYYVNNFANYTKTYGSLGGMMVLLIWLYISSIIVVMGGEINATIESMKKDI